MDPTDHAHVPYVIILVRILEDWKKSVRPFALLDDNPRRLDCTGLIQQCSIS